MPAWLHPILTIFSEILFLSAALYCVHRAQKNRIYPAFWHLLIFVIAYDSVAGLDLLANGMRLINDVHAYYIYFYVYWVSYGIQAILMLRVLHEMFRHALRSVPGMQKMGRPIFFWVLVVSIILACASGASGITSHASGMSVMLASAQVLARSQSVLALCLLSFLAFASHTLGVSFGSRIFGVVFGFGLMATGTLVNAAVLARVPSLTSSANIAFEFVYLVSISIWCVYFLRPEPARRMVAVPVSSPLVRWNEIAQALGNPAGQVAVSYPPSFMTDVHHLVNNVMGAAGWPNEAVTSRPPGPIAG